MHHTKNPRALHGSTEREQFNRTLILSRSCRRTLSRATATQGRAMFLFGTRKRESATVIVVLHPDDKRTEYQAKARIIARHHYTCRFPRGRDQGVARRKGPPRG